VRFPSCATPRVGPTSPPRATAYAGGGDGPSGGGGSKALATREVASSRAAVTHNGAALELGSTLCFPQTTCEGERLWIRSAASAMAQAEQRALHPAPLDPPPPSSAVGRALRRALPPPRLAAPCSPVVSPAVVRQRTSSWLAGGGRKGRGGEPGPPPLELGRGFGRRVCGSSTSSVINKLMIAGRESPASSVSTLEH
jgi:hypothetical protein